MNIYEKLQEARIKFLESGCKKSGYNKFTNSKYFELEDLVPTINKIMHELKFTSITIFESEKASITLINSEKPEETIVFSMPVAEAKLKACTPIQELGSQQTYLRRYLYFAVFDITENDGLDLSAGNIDIKDVSYYKGEFDKAKNTQRFTELKNEFQKSNLHDIEKKELLQYAQIKFNEIIGE